MYDNIEIIAGNNIDKQLLANIVEQIANNIKESDVLSNSQNCDCVRLAVNVKRSDYPTAQELNNKILWAIGSKDIQLSNNHIRNFLLRCLHLELEAQIENLLIVFCSKKGLSDDTKHNNITEHKQDDEEDVKSFVAIEPKFRLNKVIMSGGTKQQIERAIALIRNRKKIFEEWGFSEIDPHTKTILCFYGSPGTGKTMCAHALASELKKKILVASYASIESKWVGEGPKNLQRIFKDAEEQDAILFFDEADSFLSKRVNNAETGSDKHYNRMSNEMFQLLEDYNGIIIFATNLVSDFDKAFKSRILSFVEFEKPDSEARKRLISIMIPSRLPMFPELTDSDLEELATISEGFSGREIRKAVLTTLSEGAMSGVDSFSKEQFLVGFKSVKEETEAIETSIKETSVSNCLEDYLQYNRENEAIINVCLKAFWQFEASKDSAKQHLVRICRSLEQEIPDFSISYKDKDITEDVIIIKNANRIKECAMYCCELFAYQAEETDNCTMIISSTLLQELDIYDSDKYYSYIESIKQINKLYKL